VSAAKQKVRLLVDAGVDSIVDPTTPEDHLDPHLETLQVGLLEALGR
jgi:hypothetical protein